MKAIAALSATFVALAATAAADARIADFRHARTIAISMTDHGFAPATVTLKAGAPYILRFRNPSSRGHDFFADTFLRDARVDPADQNVVRDNKVDLDPGQSATLHIVAPTTPGARYEFHSSHLTDAASGLKGNIFVR